jgi:drug/metabolite transporter (DMT)-like permease
MTFFAVVYTMQFSYKAGVNQGIIASIFSSSIVYSAIIFYFLYDENLSHRHIVGIVFFVGCVALISIGKSKLSTNVISTDEELLLQHQYLVKAVAMALVTSLILTISSVVMRHYVKYVKISALQLNNDGTLLQMTILAILFAI